MLLDRSRGQERAGGDLPVGAALGEHPGDLPFVRRKLSPVAAAAAPRRHSRAVLPQGVTIAPGVSGRAETLIPLGDAAQLVKGFPVAAVQPRQCGAFRGSVAG